MRMCSHPLPVSMIVSPSLLAWVGCLEKPVCLFRQSQRDSPAPAWMAHFTKPLRSFRKMRSWSMVAPS